MRERESDAICERLDRLIEQNERLFAIMERIDERQFEHQSDQLAATGEQTALLTVINEGIGMLEGLVGGAVGALDEDGNPLPRDEWWGRWRS